MEHHAHRPWGRWIVGALCVLAGQSLYIRHAPASGPEVAIAFVVAVVGGILIVSALLSDVTGSH